MNRSLDSFLDALLDPTSDLAMAAAALPALASERSEVDVFEPRLRRMIYKGDSALHLAAMAYRADGIALMTRLGVPIDAVNRRGNQPLHLAAEGGPGGPTWVEAAQLRTMEALIDRGANPNAKNKDGATPLHRAVRSRCAEAVRLLIEKSADPRIRTKNGSDAARLAEVSSGRSGSGSKEARSQRERIASLLA